MEEFRVEAAQADLLLELRSEEAPSEEAPALLLVEALTAPVGPVLTVPATARLTALGHLTAQALALPLTAQDLVLNMSFQFSTPQMQHLGATEGRQNTNPTPSQVRGAVRYDTVSKQSNDFCPRAESKLHWPREQLVWERELSQQDLCSTRTRSTGGPTSTLPSPLFLIRDLQQQRGSRNLQLDCEGGCVGGAQCVAGLCACPEGIFCRNVRTSVFVSFQAKWA